MSRLADILPSLKKLRGIELRENEPMGPHTSMGVGGPARALTIIEDAGSLAQMLKLLREQQIPWMMLGGGSNTIFTEAGFSGVVVMLGRNFRKIEAGPAEHQVTAGAAANLSAVMNFSKRAGLTGMEWAAGVPGQMGGALAGNAGTPAGEMCTYVNRVEVLDSQFERVWRKRGEFEFQYRKSALRSDVILGAVLQFEAGDPREIQRRIDLGLKKRGEQPVGQRCSGCMFKNPDGDYAGRLIDQAGFKGFRIGGAMVSDEHANFVINDQNATAEEIMELVHEVRRGVYQKSGRELKLEIRLVDPVRGPWANQD